MFTSIKQRLFLGLFIFLLLSIPAGAYLVSQNQTIQSKAADSKPKPKTVTVTPKATTSPAKKLLSLTEESVPSVTEDTPSDSTTIATSFGPTLSLKVNLEGRAQDAYSTRLFVGIIEGDLTTNPKFLLNFTVDLPASGVYSNLSLAGLNAGSKYTALLKGSAQIATSSAFIMSPTVTNLNEGNALKLLSGDLNDDNIINSGDYAIAMSAFGSSSASANWNQVADLNLDGRVNIIDLGIISKNLGTAGASGTWTSPIPQSGTASGSLDTPPVGSPNQSVGYWIWIPMH